MKVNFSINRDKIDFVAPLVVSCSGWLLLLAYLYFSYIRDSKNLAALLSADNGAARIWTILILVSPLISSVFGYVLDERLKTYRTNYHQHFKDLYEDELRDTLDHLILSFVNALDSKSSWTKGHSFRVQYYSTMIAHELDLSESQTELLSISALLHDIGKIGTYDDILNKTEQLTSEEFAMIKKHPDNAVKILEPITQFSDLLPIIRGHHERVDGLGYPDGLKGDKIPLLARILCVADAFDAITSERPYKTSIDRERAIDLMQSLSGTQFDAGVVSALVLAYSRPDFNAVI